MAFYKGLSEKSKVHDKHKGSSLNGILQGFE
ncbi:hypothetical protein T4D_2866 [Trichinella pseudospiralis]|uniref:Uncharacterized protein n=1 Tax=Trichinella pseudospiralis TaxID=6337 RepID=A0A0V1DQS1_TRIPS|nr:hypothetical protein T4D_2866 [Trichinella pseudospiralis]